MLKRIYWTYRPRYLNKWEWKYTASYFLDQQYADYKEAGITKTLDMEIPEDRYTTEIAPWIKKQTRLIIWEYEDTIVDPVLYAKNVANVWAEFQIEIFPTTAEAIVWIKANTSLVETTPWKFLVNPAGTDIMWKPTLATYLTIV